MGLASGLAVYFITWWTILFAILPWGIEADPATGQVGAPKAPKLKQKFIITTLVSAVIWLAIYWLVSNPEFLPFRHMARQMPL